MEKAKSQKSSNRIRPPADDYERIVRRIVEGQIRGFIKEHPTVLDGVDWYKPRRDKAKTLVNSLAKRIVRDLACQTTRARLAQVSTGSFAGDTA